MRATESGAGSGLPEYLDLKNGKASSVGLLSEPSTDKIAELKPDLIIGSKVRHEAIYSDRSAIVQSVFSVNSEAVWQEQARVTAVAVGQSEKMEAQLASLEIHVHEVGEEIGSEGTTLSMVRFCPDNFRLYGPDSF